jgi:hypothetical protein
MAKCYHGRKCGNNVCKTRKALRSASRGFLERFKSVDNVEPGKALTSPAFVGILGVHNSFLGLTVMTAHGPRRWRQREGSRAIRAVEQAGLTVSGFEVAPDGTIRVLLASHGSGNQEVAPEINEWDRDLDGPTPVPVRS